MRELCKVAEDYGIVLAMQNHGPDIVNRYQDVLSLIEEVGSPVFKACMDINIEPEADSPEHAREMAAASGRAASPFAYERRVRETPRTAQWNWWPAAISISSSGEGRSPIRLTSMRWSRPDTRATWTGSSVIPRWRTGKPGGHRVRPQPDANGVRVPLGPARRGRAEGHGYYPPASRGPQR